MKPIVTLPEGVKAELEKSQLVISPMGPGRFLATIVKDCPENNIFSYGDSPQEAIANLEQELWRRAAISEK